ncbi:MAG: response regulator [Candidatus Gottesmanbacteria bacterium]
MSPERARIFIVEDNEDFQNLYKIDLENNGHIVVKTARTQDEAMEIINELGNLGIQVTILDQNDNINGVAVATAIRSKHPEIKLIGFVGGEPFPNVDAFASKLYPEHLSRVVTEI